MKRLVIIFIALAMVLLACDISTTATPPVVTEPPVITEPPVTPTNVTCNELAFFLDPLLASGYSCQTIPESSGPDYAYFEIYPQYTQLSLQGYILPDTFLPPHISVFPVQRFRELIPDVVNERVTALQALISGGPVAADAALPLLPVFNAAQMFYAQYAVILFQNGSGIRYLTMYGQAYYPVNNYHMFYSFQGLTSDGQYWVSVILPISHPVLPPTGDNPPDGSTWDEFYANVEQYFDDTTVLLNGQPADSFIPTLPALDAMIASIIIQP